MIKISSAKNFAQAYPQLIQLIQLINLSSFEESLLGVLNKNAPLKKKVLRANHAPFVTKALRKAIMKRSYLEKLYLKKKTTESLKNYKKHKNF